MHFKKMPAKSPTSSVASSVSLMDFNYSPNYKSHKYYTRLQERRQTIEANNMHELSFTNDNPGEYNVLEAENSQFLDNSYQLENKAKDLILYNNEDARKIEINENSSLAKIIFTAIIIGLLGIIYLQTTGKINNLYDEVKNNLYNVKNVEKKMEELINILNQPSPEPNCNNKDISDLQLANIIKQIINIYDADKIGRVDYALESAGGKILEIKGTNNFIGQPSIVHKIFEKPTQSHLPNMMITPGTSPGECWAFHGSSGIAVIQLIDYIFVTGVTLEHIPKAISPSKQIDSAPREFSIMGKLDNGLELLGTFKYDENGEALQYFAVEKKPVPFNIIEFYIHSNHGNEKFTCVYRIRVHGDLANNGKTFKNILY